MGFRLQFKRLNQARFQEFVHPNQHDSATSLDNQRTDMYFWPMTDGELTDEYNHLCIEKSYWELLDEIVSATIPDDSSSVCHLLKDGQALVHDSWKYVEGCIYSPDDTQELLRALSTLSGTHLRRRFAFVVYGSHLQELTASEPQSSETDTEDDLFLAIEFCFETTKQFVTFAVANQQALLCYVS